MGTHIVHNYANSILISDLAVINLLTTNNWKPPHHNTFSFMMSLPAVSLVDGFCMSRKSVTRGGGWVQTAWQCLGSGLKMGLFSPCMHNLAWKSPHLVGLPFLALKIFHSLDNRVVFG